jgi:RNA polymerase sigma-70 factor (ECF subfamily)
MLLCGLTSGDAARGDPWCKGRRPAGLIGANRAARLHPALVNGAAGVVVTVHGRSLAVLGFTVTDGKIVEIDAIADPDRVRRIAATVLTDE